MSKQEELIQLTIELEELSPSKYHEWSAEQLDDYWWETIMPGFDEEYLEGQCEVLKKQIEGLKSDVRTKVLKLTASEFLLLRASLQTSIRLSNSLEAAEAYQNILNQVNEIINE
ncbi:hypothetical protein [uncultured Microscilla sp.]|uniref:hypothetical protein n=1 Tax=uncultured Microscilla sp. TaxID=432653 RepID=UPI00262B3FA8|nr:hypothetical protein [uncultured Microscilla sp.]